MREFLIQALATLVGALSAFGLEELRRRRQERNKQIEHFKAALFVLLLHRTFLRTLHAQHLEPARDNPVRAYAMKAIIAAPPSERLDVSGLAFLLSSKDAQLLNTLCVAESQYRTVVALVERRNAVNLTLQSKPEVTIEAPPGIVPGSLQDLRAVAGPMLSRQLEQLTDALYEHSEHAIRFNEECYREAVASYKRLFPGATMFGVEDMPIGQSSNTAPR
jgi:hypothetical protein